MLISDQILARSFAGCMFKYMSPIVEKSHVHVIVFGESDYAQYERRRHHSHHTRDQIYFLRTNGREQWYHEGEDHIMALQVTWSHLVNIIPVGLVDVALEDFEFWSAKELARKTGREVKV